MRLARVQATEVLPLNPPNTPVTQSTVMVTPPPSSTPTDRDSSLATGGNGSQYSTMLSRVDISASSACSEISQTVEPLGPEQPHLLETIAEADCEVTSSCGTGRTDRGSVRGEVMADTKFPASGVQTDFEHGGRDALPTEMAEEPLDTSPWPSPREPTVLISSNSPATHQPLIETAPLYK